MNNGVFHWKTEGQMGSIENSFGIGENARAPPLPDNCPGKGGKNSFNKVTYTIPRGKWGTFSRELQVCLQRVQHDLCQDRGAWFECAFGRMCPTIWPQFEMCWDIKLQVGFRPQLCPLQGQAILPSTVERITCTASWACPIIVCLISVMPFKKPASYCTREIIQDKTLLSANLLLKAYSASF